MAFDRSTARPVTSTKKAFAPAPRPFYEEAAERTEQAIGQRPSSIGFLRQAATSPSLVQQHPFQTAFSAVGAPFEAAESIPANIGLGIQQRTPLPQLFQNVARGVRGERPAQMGDIARASGLPGISSEPAASAIGLLTSVSPATTFQAGRKVLGSASRGLTAPFRNIGRTGTFGARAKFTERVRGQILQGREALGTKFGDQVDSALAQKSAQQGQAVRFDLTNAATQLQDMIRENPGLLSQIKSGGKTAGCDLIELIAQDPSLAADLGFSEVQAIKSALSQAPRVATSATKAGVTTGGTRQLLIVKDAIRREQLRAVPELEGVFKEFAEGMDDFRTLQPSLTMGKRPVQLEKSLLSQGSDIMETGSGRGALQRTLANVPEGKPTFGGTSRPFSDVLGARRTAVAGEMLKRYGFLIPLGGGAAFLGSRFLSRRVGEGGQD
mgnify:CR=1 FL=1